MINVRCIKVEFEALGQSRVGYTIFNDLQVIEKVIKMITPTAHLNAVSSVMIDKSEYKKKNLGRIVEIHHKYINEYKNI